jgi:hypothetical protein
MESAAMSIKLLYENDVGLHRIRRDYGQAAQQAAQTITDPPTMSSGMAAVGMRIAAN